MIIVELGPHIMSDDERVALEDSTVAAPTPGVSSVSLKIPPFWPADPQVWFAQVEAQFCTRGVTSQKTKFDYIIASLSPEYAMEVRDLILKPPSTTPYTVLKDQLIQCTAASKQRRLQQLFNSEDLGDRKPSQLLRRMQQLLDDKFSSTDASFLKELFLQRLPGNVRMVLASIDSKDLETLASTADKIMEVSTTPVCSVTSSVNIDQLRSEIEELRQLVEKLVSAKPQFRSRTPRRSPSPSPASVSSHQQLSSPTMCWYHQRFGADAKKCCSPCSYSGNEQASH